jgi:predicted Zn-dependent protease
MAEIASATNTFNNYFRTFESTMRNFNTLNDPDKLNRQPEHVYVKPVQQSTTLAQALSSYNVPQKRQEEVAVLNGMLLNDRLEKGTLIKIIQ